MSPKSMIPTLEPEPGTGSGMRGLMRGMRGLGRADRRGRGRGRGRSGPAIEVRIGKIYQYGNYNNKIKRCLQI